MGGGGGIWTNVWGVPGGVYIREAQIYIKKIEKQKKKNTESGGCRLSFEGVFTPPRGEGWKNITAVGIGI